MKKYGKGHKWVPDGSFWWCDKIKLHPRSFPDVLEKSIFSRTKSWSLKALDHVLDTSDGGLTHPKRPQTYLKGSKIEMFLNIFIIYDHHTWSSYMMIIYDDRLWWSSMMIVYDDRLWWSSMIIVYDYRLRLSSKTIV